MQSTNLLYTVLFFTVAFATPISKLSTAQSSAERNIISFPVESPDIILSTLEELLFPSAEPDELLLPSIAPDEPEPTYAPEEEIFPSFEPTETEVPEINITSEARAKRKWETVAATGSVTARHEACYVAAPNGKHYLIGGRRVNNVGIYDPVTKTWTSTAGPDVEIHHMQCVVSDDGIIWIPASWYGGYPNEQNHPSMFIFNTNSNTWGTRTGLPAARRRGSTAVALMDEKIYVSHGNTGGHGAHSQSVGWFDVYDIDEDKWTALPTAPNARDHTGGGIVGGRFCVAAGRRGDSLEFNNNPVTLTDCYNFGTGAWEIAPAISPGRAGSSYGSLCGGGLIVAGGEGFGKAFDDVNVFGGNGWRSLGKLNQARHGTGVAVSSCECGQLTVASGSGAQGGGPELTSVEVWKVDGEETCA